VSKLGSTHDHTMRFTASVNEDLTVWLYLICADIQTDLGVFGPFTSREQADGAANEVLAQAVRMFEKSKERLLAGMVSV
jgi:hypothetical protein